MGAKHAVCQWDVVGGSVAGIDAGVGAYALYRSPSGPFCSPGTNQSLPTDIQSAVCNKDIKLANFLYNLFWNDGAWFYVYTMDTAVADEAATNNNMYTNCNSTTSTTLSSSHITITTSAPSAPSQTTTVASADSAQSSKISIIVGAVIGSVAALVIAIAVVRFRWRKRQRRLARVPLDVDNLYAPGVEVISPYTVPDSTSGNRSSYGFGRARKGGHLPMSSNFSSRSRSTTALAASVSESSQRSSDLLRNASSSIGLRHEDAGAVPTLLRSGSGRLPPAYDPVWEDPRDAPSRQNVDPNSEYQEGEFPSHSSDREPSVQRNKP
ncbi:hypothetical protein AZE42_06893 [Rhizopogon vesiculosus]|uniref:Uncharacterized protein n=1 Tax=Rhizopogon vesiculosus TaxID=180088 RepID=A0A1J8QVW9_9AGAM|nr:hypothetical protein AZE42_06893 [Rhizopogon vesiculosus]